MTHIKTLVKPTLTCDAAGTGCGECQTSCQSACKTSATVGNQPCENKNRKQKIKEAKESVKLS